MKRGPSASSTLGMPLRYKINYSKLRVMKTRAITIITPVYNGEKFIESCLKVIVAQNCPEAEHVIIDGGSTDGTVGIIQRYAERYPHIRWVSEKDSGQSEALNKGIALAKGPILGILNFDDYYEPDVLRRALKIFETLPEPAMVVANCNVLNDDGVVTYINRPARLSLANILIGGEANQFPYNPSSYFYHKSLHEKVGLYDVRQHYTMDLDFLLRAVPAARIRYVDETWGNFRYIKGCKTYQLANSEQLYPMKQRLLNSYLEKLPWFQRCWIQFVRAIFISKRPHYYSGRIMDLIKNPGEIPVVISKKLKKTPAERSKLS